MNLTLEQMARAMQAAGDLRDREDFVPARIVTDSRRAGDGDVFFCIAGDNFDGHVFASGAVAKGAAVVVSERPLPEVDQSVPVLLVQSTVQALGRLGAYWRSLAKARVVGVTGTAGKTTVKELLAHVLSHAGKVHKNQGNLNNQIGLPMSLLQADGDEDYWVLEAGISRARDMDELGEMLRPDLALVVNVGQAHLEGLGDVSGVADQKARLLVHAAELGRGVVSADYPELVAAAAKVQAGRDICVDFFSLRPEGAPYWAECLGQGGRFRLSLRGDEIQVDLPLPGRQGAENALAAAAAAHVLGMQAQDIQAAFAGFAMPEQRFAPRKVGAWLLVDDSYNANPLSMTAALDAVRSMAVNGELITALGEMRELGPAAEAAHEQLGRDLAERKVGAVFWSGGHAKDVARGLQAGGYGGSFMEVRGADDFLKAWRGLGAVKGVVLFKGSRANRLEELHQALCRELLA